jgi:hypothetical protein
VAGGILGGARARPLVGAVDAAELLAVAGDHRGGGVVDGVCFAGGVDRGPAAVVAARDGDLVARPPFLRRAAQSPPGDLVEERVVVGVSAEVLPYSRLEVAEEREGFCADVEAEAVLHERWIRTVRWFGAQLAGCDGALDFLRASGLGPFEPGVLGGACRDPRELANRGPAELAGGERAIELRERRERAADAQALLRLAAAQADDALGVLTEAGVAGAGVHAETLCAEEPATEVALVAGASGTERNDPSVRFGPVSRRLRVDRLRPVGRDLFARDEVRARQVRMERMQRCIHGTGIPRDFSASPLPTWRVFATLLEIFHAAAPKLR